MSDPVAISACLQHWARVKRDHPALLFLPDGEAEGPRLTYGELHSRSASVAKRLKAIGVRGRPVLLLYPSGPDFIAALFGCFYAGAVAVPLPLNIRHHSFERIRLVISDADPVAILTVEGSQAALRAMAPDLPCLATDIFEDDPAEPALLQGQDPAIMQYTSGSTGDPKGVVLTHSAIMANMKMQRYALGEDVDTRFLSWLPLFHDMGLFGALLISIYYGADCVFLPPVSFLQKPDRWLRAISRYRATISGGPNFAFDLCSRRVARMALDGVDLSSWKIAFCGAERVRAGTLEAFAATFSAWGFETSALFPCYGLAEATLFVSGGPRGSGIRLSEPAGIAAGQVVSCGKLAPQQLVKIVDPDSETEVAEGERGEIWISGDHVGRGYWSDAGKTAKTFHAVLEGHPCRFLRTGDLGFLRDRELYVTGRLKDTLIVRGQNIAPDDVEATVAESVQGFAATTAAFAVDVDDVERIVVVQEIEREYLRRLDPKSAISAAADAVAERHGFKLHDLVLVPPGAIPKTTSGKVQRRRCREAYLAASLKTLLAWRAPVAGGASTRGSAARPQHRPR